MLITLVLSINSLQTVCVLLQTCRQFVEGALMYSFYYVHPTGGWTYYFCFFRRPPSGVWRPTWFPDILGNSSYPIFTKFGMQVYWVNSLYGIAFGDDSSIAN